MSPPGRPLSDQLQEIRSRISLKQTFWLLSVGVAIATFLLGIVLIQNPWQEKERQLAGLSSEEEQRGVLLLSLRNQWKTLRAAEQDRMLVGGSPVLTSHVAGIARATGLEIESVTPQPETALPPYTKFQIEVVASAKLKNLTNFLHALEQHRPLLVANEITVQTLELSAKTGSGFNPYASQKQRSVEINKETRHIRLLISSYNRKVNP